MIYKPSFRYNGYGVKSSGDQYRNINGVHYVCYSADPDNIPGYIKEAQANGLKTKIIKGELYVEDKG